MKHRPKPERSILFVPAFLSDHGGFEENLLAFVREAVAAGWAATVLTPKRLPETYRIRARLEGLAGVRSAEDAWLSSAPARLLAAKPALDGSIQRSGLPAKIANALSAVAMRTFWETAGRRALADSQIVHCFGKPNQFVTRCIGSAKAASKPVAYSEIAEVDAEYGQRFRTGLADLRRADLATAYSARQAHAMRRHFGFGGPVHIIEQWAFGDETELLDLPAASPSERLTLGSLSRLGPEKDVTTLVRAVAIALERGLKVRLRIAGIGPELSKILELVVDSAIGAHVELVGFVEDRVAFMSSLDAFVISSLQEGGPISGVEAMAAARAIVTTPCGAMPERLEEGVSGLFFEAGSSENLADRICTLAQNLTLVGNLGTQARARYLARNRRDHNSSLLVSHWEALRTAR